MLSHNFTGFEQQTFWKQHPFTPKIYDGEGEPSEGFNALRIVLDLSECSLLNWKGALLKAERSIQKGYLILWDLQFALLEGSLQDETRFLTLLLNVKHFNEAVLLKFQEHTLGVSLFRGKVDLSEGVIDYLKSLSASLPEEVSCFLFLDTTYITDRATFFQLINPEIFGHLNLILKGPLAERYPYASAHFAWGQGGSCLGFCSTRLENILPMQLVSDALCLSEGIDNTLWERALDSFGSKPFRVIPESLLTQEWEGIDRLMIIPQTLSERGWRKIRGFEAAGGRIISFQDDVALLRPQETSLPSSPGV